MFLLAWAPTAALVITGNSPARSVALDEGVARRASCRLEPGRLWIGGAAALKVSAAYRPYLALQVVAGDVARAFAPGRTGGARRVAVSTSSYGGWTPVW